MMNITESLINDYLVESYIAQPAGSEADRLAAEKAFKSELTNGPEKMVYYSGKGSFAKKVGSFDLDNFHKAYDKWFDDNNLLDIFTDDGKLVNRGTYTRFKDLNKKEPAVKALGQLWGTQFNRDMEFLDAKLVRVKAEEDKAAAEAKLKQDQKDCIARFNDPAVLNKITSTKEWTDLINMYPAEDRANIKPVVSVDFYYRSTEPATVVLEITGVIPPPNGAADITKIVFKDRDTHTSEEDIIKQITDPKAIADLLVGIKRIYPAAMQLINNYAEYTKRPEADIDCLRIANSHNRLVYFDRETNKYYRAVTKVFQISAGHSKNGLMLIDVDNDQNRSGRLSAACILVAARTDYSHTTGRCYVSTYYNDYYNSKWVNDSLAEKLNIYTEDHKGNWNCDYNVSIQGPNNFRHPELSKFFDKESRYQYECDSGD